MQRRYLYRFLEFLLVGFIMGITEDLIAIHFATDAIITPHIIWVAALVALPFAIISELIVDWTHMKYLRRRWKQKFLSVKNTVDHKRKQVQKEVQKEVKKKAPFIR